MPSSTTTLIRNYTNAMEELDRELDYLDIDSLISMILDVCTTRESKQTIQGFVLKYTSLP